MSEEVTERPLTPEARAHMATPAGVPIRLADGAEWTLAYGGTTPALDDLRDRLHDDSQLAGTVGRDDVIWTAWALLARNYDADIAEIAGLFEGIPLQTIADAVMGAMFGQDTGHVTYSQWMRSALHANGLDPAAVPGDLLHFVLDHLVQGRRAVAGQDAISSAVAAAARKDIAATFD